MRPTIPFALTFLLLLTGCATEPTQQAGSAAKAPAEASPARREEAELVTGSRIPVRGAQPVGTIDKEDITRNSRVIGSPPKGN